jgi:hypothetical protein
MQRRRSTKARKPARSLAFVLAATLVMILATPADATQANSESVAAEPGDPAPSCIHYVRHRHVLVQEVHVTNNCSNSLTFTDVKVLINRGGDSSCKWLSPGATFAHQYSHAASFRKIVRCEYTCPHRPPPWGGVCA